MNFLGRCDAGGQRWASVCQPHLQQHVCSLVSIHSWIGGITSLGGPFWWHKLQAPQLYTHGQTLLVHPTSLQSFTFPIALDFSISYLAPVESTKSDVLSLHLESCPRSPLECSTVQAWGHRVSPLASAQFSRCSVTENILRAFLSLKVWSWARSLGGYKGFFFLHGVRWLQASLWQMAQKG